MKIIDWKAYKEIDINELEKTELIEIIEWLQKELESKKLTWVITAPYPNPLTQPNIRKLDYPNINWLVYTNEASNC